MDISIVIPAYNEANKIVTDISEADKFLIENNINGEIIVVDDGSSDNTSEIAEAQSNSIKATLNVIKLIKNKGKGAAIREGVLNSNGNIIMFVDAGFTVPFDNALQGIKLIVNKQCDIANGSRKMIGSNIINHQKFNRKIFSSIVGFLVKKLLHIPNEFTDTQCGFKIYKGVIAKELFNIVKIDGFLFEIEFILLALKKGFKIVEFPVQWNCDVDSRISVKNSSINVLKDFIYLLKNY